MSIRKILKRGKKKPTKNLGLIRGGSWGSGGIKKVNGSWAQGVKPKAAEKLALKASTSLTKIQSPKIKGVSNSKIKRTSPAFRKTVKALNKATQPPMRKGLQMLKKQTKPIPKNVQPTRKIKRSAPKR